MSGIAGILQRDGAPANAELLQQMAEFLRFRGPDGTRVWTSGGVGFVHAALHTTPESRLCRQPVELQLRWFLTGDVRLDGIEELARKLRSRGAEISPVTDDSLLVLHAYGIWGRDCLQHLRGDFCFALWDAPNRRLFCARDPLGVKPFFYARAGDAFIFSNTLDCIRLHPAVSDDLDELEVGDFLLTGWPQRPEGTIFADVRRLPAAHWLEFDHDIVSTGRYWQLPCQETDSGGSASEQRETFSALLLQSVKERTRGGTAGVLLSGGMDSPAVAAYAVRAGVEVRAHTAGYDQMAADVEPAAAKTVAEALRIPWQYHPQDDVPLMAEYAVCPQPEPSVELMGSVLQQELAAVSSYTATALTGEGGDVLLVPPTPSAGLHLGHFPGAVKYLLRSQKLPRLGIRTALRGRLRRAGPKPFPAWIHPDFERRAGLRQRWQEVNRDPNPIHRTRPRVHRSLSSLFWPSVFEGYDPGITRRPVLIAHPLLSTSLIEFVLAASIGFENLVNKGMLRELTRDLLPESIRCRPKTPMQADFVAEKISRRMWYEAPREVPARLHDYVKPGTLCAFPELVGEPAATGHEILPVIALRYWLHDYRWIRFQPDRLASRMATESPPCSL